MIDLLRQSVKVIRPKFIAEEFSEQDLDDQSAESVAMGIALEFGIAHKFCDPNEEERREIGYEGHVSIFHTLWMHNDEELPDDELQTRAQAIMIGRYFAVREKFWLKRLSECPNGSGIFICGDGHIESFTHLLNANKIGWQVVARRVGFVPGEDAGIQEAMRYLREHPELANWEKYRRSSSA